MFASDAYDVNIESRSSWSDSCKRCTRSVGWIWLWLAKIGYLLATLVASFITFRLAIHGARADIEREDGLKQGLFMSIYMTILNFCVLLVVFFMFVKHHLYDNV
jgi:hypothetical protein